MAGSRITAFGDEIHPSLDVQLRVMKRLGLSALDVRSVDGVNVSQLTDAALAEAREKVDAAGLRVACVGSPVNKVPLRPELRVEEMQRLARCIEAARTLGTDRIRIFSPEAGDDPYDRAWPMVRAWLDEMVVMAAGEGIVLLHENDAKYYGAYPVNARRLAEALGGPHFRLVFDFANTVLLGFDPVEDWLPWIVPFLDSLHIKDAVRAEGRVVAAGEGDGRMAEFLAALAEAGWSGDLSMEPHLEAAGPMGGFSGEQRFEVAVAALRKVLPAAWTAGEAAQG